MPQPPRPRRTSARSRAPRLRRASACFQQALALRVLGQQRPGVVSIHGQFQHLNAGAASMTNVSVRSPASPTDPRMTDRCDRRRRRPALDTEFTRGLGLYDSTMVVVGSMIGSGIFIVSADMARNVGSPGWLLAAWLLTGAPDGRRRAVLRRAGGDDAARRRPVRLPARGVLAALGIPLRLDAVPGHPDRHDRRGGGRLRALFSACSCRGLPTTTT